jgi:hypothetical protein
VQLGCEFRAPIAPRIQKPWSTTEDASIVRAPDHLTQVFEEAERLHPELMERYSILLVQAFDDAAERKAIMRRGLRETFRLRYPMPEGFYDGEAAA